MAAWNYHVKTFYDKQLVKTFYNKTFGEATNSKRISMNGDQVNFYFWSKGKIYDWGLLISAQNDFYNMSSCYIV